MEPWIETSATYGGIDKTMKASEAYMNQPIDTDFPVPPPGIVDMPYQLGAERRGTLWMRCPSGYPTGLNLTALANHLATVPVLREFSEKARHLKQIGTAKKKDMFEVFPASQSGLAKLSDRQLKNVMIAADGEVRSKMVESCLVEDHAEAILEIWLINRWLKARVAKNLSAMDEQLREEGAKGLGLIGTGVPEYLDGVDAVVGALVGRLPGTGFEGMIYGLIQRGYIRMMYQDLMDGGKHANRAACAIYGIASLADSRWPLDMVWEHSEELYDRHYGEMVYGPLAEAIRDAYILQQKLGYTPLPFKLNTPEVIAKLNLMITQPLMAFAEDVAGYLSSALVPTLQDTEAPDADLSLMDQDFDRLVEGADISERAIKAFRTKANIVAATTLKGRLQEMIERIEQLHRTFCSAAPEYDTAGNPSVDHIVSARKEFEAFVDQYECLPVPGRESALMRVVAKAMNDFDLEEELLGKLIKAGDELKDRIAKLAVEDPVRNRDKINECYEKIEALSGDMDKANTVIGDWGSQAQLAIQREIQIWTRFKEQLTPAPREDAQPEGRQSRHDEKEELEALLALATNENQELQSKNLGLAARVQTLEMGLAARRESEASQGVDGRVREAMQLALEGGNQITPSQCLLLIKAIYPETDILPSAWTSAEEAACFEQTDRLWQSLTVLAGKYVAAINGGTPDSEARNLFTSSQYAANESKTTSRSSDLRKHREFVYQGARVFFEQHLRIGVAKDVRQTIRVYFKIIEGRLVIAHCGEHRKL